MLKSIARYAYLVWPVDPFNGDNICCVLFGNICSGWSFYSIFFFLRLLWEMQDWFHLTYSNPNSWNRLFNAHVMVRVLPHMVSGLSEKHFPVCMRTMQHTLQVTFSATPSYNFWFHQFSENSCHFLLIYFCFCKIAYRESFFVGNIF